MNQKVFFLGGSKMGTKSIYLSLMKAGLKACHKPKFSLYSHMHNPDSIFFNKYDYFTDGNMHNFKNLQKWFPGSKFILLQRDPEKWLNSLYSFHQDSDERHPESKTFLKSTQWIFNGIFSLSRNLTGILLYSKRVKIHFNNSQNFLILDLEAEGKEGWIRLSKFIGVHLEEHHGNKTKNRVHVNQLSQIVAKSKEQVERFSSEYPEIYSHYSYRSLLFNWTHKTLVRRFTEEKWLVKNLKKSAQVFRSSPLESTTKSIMHINYFFLIVFCLILRIFLVRKDRIASPFLL